jgi:putative DNA primase/helicase
LGRPRETPLMMSEGLCRCGRRILDGIFCPECGFAATTCKCASIDNVVAISTAPERGRKTKVPAAPFVSDDRPEVDAGIGDLAEASGEAQGALQRANQPARYFSHGGELVRIEHDDDGRPFTRPLGVNHLRHHLARAAHYFKDTQAGRVNARPPQDVVQDLLASPERMWPTLRRIVSVPVFAADGTICQTPGYNPPARAWYDPNGLTIADIPDAPDELAVAAAVDLTMEVLSDFPFVEDADRAHALAMMIQPFARDLIPGPTPLYLVEKPEPGTGATLLANVTLHPALGRPPRTFTEATGEEEWRKRLTSALREAPDAVLIENLHGKLSTAALAAVLTIDEWGDRLLGVSEMVRLPVRCVWVATANNPRLSTEMIRRSVRIRMDSGTEQPWLREPASFRHPNLRDWTHERRADLVEACLVIVRAWIAAGRQEGPAVLGMFEPWAKTMSGILQVAGIDGFLENTEDFYSSMAEDDENLTEFVGRWFERFRDHTVGVSELMVVAIDALDLGKGSDRSQSTVFGQLLRENRDRRFGDLAIRRAGTKSGAAQWRLEHI